MSIDVFLSVGRTSTLQQEEFVRRIEDHLRANGFSPHTVGRNDWSFKSPLLKVRALMQQCVGAVIISFERLFIAEGTEERGSENPISLTAIKLPTVWNQIEAAMAYLLDMPLLVIVERGLRSEGLLDRGMTGMFNR